MIYLRHVFSPVSPSKILHTCVVCSVVDPDPGPDPDPDGSKLFSRIRIRIQKKQFGSDPSNSG